MENSTLGLIYALKNREKGSLDESVIDFYSKYTCSPKSAYNKNNLTRIAVNAMCDYISTADNPSYVMREFFEYMHLDYKSAIRFGGNYDDRIRESVWTTLLLTQVRNDNGFVNGFREYKEED